METNQQDTAVWLAQALNSANVGIPDVAVAKVARAIDERDVDPTGAWVVYYWNGEGNRVLSIHAREIEALRAAVGHAWANEAKVKFVKYGEEDML